MANFGGLNWATLFHVDFLFQYFSYHTFLCYMALILLVRVGHFSLLCCRG